MLEELCTIAYLLPSAIGEGDTGSELEPLHQRVESQKIWLCSDNDHLNDSMVTLLQAWPYSQIPLFYSFTFSEGELKEPLPSPLETFIVFCFLG